MSEALFKGIMESLTEEQQPSGFALTPGVVTNPFDLISEGRVQVKIPAKPGFEPWARLAAVGGGADRGFLWAPQIDDEVLVALAQNDDRDAYILGGLWSTMDRPPALSPTDPLIKRVIKTGIDPVPGHEVEFDDALQSITITSSTKQKISIDPTAIEVSTTGGSVSLKLDLTTQTVSVTAPKAIEMKAADISLEGVSVSVKAGKIDLQAAGVCTVQGSLVKIN